MRNGDANEVRGYGMVEEREYKETTEAKSKRQCQEPRGLASSTRAWLW